MKIVIYGSLAIGAFFAIISLCIAQATAAAWTVTQAIEHGVSSLVVVCVTVAVLVAIGFLEGALLGLFLLRYVK